MFAQTIQAGFRNIWRRPLLPILNILGLAMGVAVATVIFLYAGVELNYNSWVKDQRNLYRVEGQFLRSSNGGYAVTTMSPLGPEIQADVDEAASVVRVWRPFDAVKRDQFLNYESVSYSDPGFFQMFPFEFIRGSSDGFYDTSNRVALSESMAIKYFGSTDIIGETMVIDGDQNYSVYAVFNDIPDASDFEFNFVMKLDVDRAGRTDSWSNQWLHTFVRLHEGSSIADVEEKLALMADKHRPFTGSAPGNMREIYRFFLQPFSDIHLGSQGRTSDASIGQYATVYGFVAVALLILTISIFNYVSLATARAVEREKEFCLRKVSGATAWQVTKHVMTEMFAQTLPAVAIGLLIASDLIPFFSDFIGVEYSFSVLFSPVGIGTIILGTIGVSVLSGLYPALIISRFRPVKFLSGGRSQRPAVMRMRTALVFLQFTVAIALIISVVTIGKQMAFIGKIDLGFETENLAVVRGVLAEGQTSQAKAFMERVKALPGVEIAARAGVVPNDNSFYYEGFVSEHITFENSIGSRIIAADFDLFETLGAQLVAGRMLNDQYADDKINMFDYDAMRVSRGNRNVVINQEAMRRLGYATPSAVLGKQVSMVLEPSGASDVTIVGVVGNIAYQSARSEMEPRFYTYYEPRMGTLAVRLRDGQEQPTVEAIENVWREMYPDTPFRMQYMEERIDALYADERQQLRLFLTFSVLAIILSLIGLIGLVLNSVMHRTKEISIRRVLGATVRDNVKLFTWQYLKPVLIANVPAWAAAYYFLNNWLSKYPSRIDIGVDLYLWGSGAIIAVTLILVALIVTRVADTPPAHALKYE